MYNATYTENKLLTIFWRGSVTSRAYYLGGNNMIGFGNYGKRQAEATLIKALTDIRLVRIDPQEDGFFEDVLNLGSEDNAINAFIEAVAEVKAENLEAFYRPIYDPSEVSDHMVTYQNGKRPAVGHTYIWWVKTASKMPSVEGRQWKIATEYQYYAFLVWLINQLVKDGKSVELAVKMVVLDSKEIGHYRDSENSTEGADFENTGSRCVCGVYDLANTYKFLSCSNEEAGGFWIGGGRYRTHGRYNPLACLDLYSIAADGDYNNSVGLLVL